MADSTVVPGYLARCNCSPYGGSWGKGVTMKKALENAIKEAPFSKISNTQLYSTSDLSTVACNGLGDLTAEDITKVKQWNGKPTRKELKELVT